MKLMESIDRKPLCVGFGHAGGASGTFDVERDASSVSLVTQTGTQTDLPSANGFDAGLMSAADKTKLDGLANSTVTVDPANFETRAQAVAADIDPGIMFVRTAGFATRSDGGGALYHRADVEPTHTMKFQSNDGAFWEFVAENGTVNEKQAGGVGDGVADDTQAIQAAIDFALYQNPPFNTAQAVEVVIIGPRCLISDTIHLGYGETIHGVTVRGIARRRRGESVYVGTALFATFTDRPIINFQGIRGGWLKDLWIEGALDFSVINPHGWDVNLESTWDALGGNGRYNPYAAITVDAFSGNRPVASYPDVNYPAYIGPQTQYGKVFSSDIGIQNVGVRSVNTAVAVQPSDLDSNGDFVKVVNCNFEECKYGISVGNGQSRNVEVRNLIGANMFVTFTNVAHGRRNGRFGGPIENVSLGRFIGRIFEFDSTTTLGTTLFTTLYVENLDRIGDFTGDTGSEGTLTFDSCLFSFRHDDLTGVPANVLGDSNSSNIVFRACRFANARSVYSFKVPRVYMEHCSINVIERGSGSVELYEAHAHNATSGGLVLDPLNLRPQQLRFPQADLSSGNIIGDVGPDEGFFGSVGRERCIPLALWEFSRQSQIYSTPTRKRYNYFERTRGVHFSNVELIDRTLTLEFNSLTDHEAMRLGVLPGDIIRDKTTGMIFFITSRVGTTVTAMAQNNYRIDEMGEYATIVPFDLASGGLQFVNSRMYTPSYLTLGDFTDGSNIVTNAARDDGFAAYLDADIAVGDYLFADQDPDRVFSAAEAEVIAVDTAAQTITFAGNARSTVARKEMSQWIRQAPPNM
ncbi:MAG: hypothetical protein AAF479_00945 [Pseudomonadota bacterium]